jgi:carbamoyl-phosphate synthase large subunit
MNVLFSSVGKRVELVNTFHSALSNLNIKTKLFGADLNPEMCPARFVLNDCFKVPAVTADNFISEIIKISLKNEITVIIPTIDTELLVYANHLEELLTHNIQVVLSEIELITSCRDKRKTNRLFKSLNIDVPEERFISCPVFPIFAKPYDGSLSKDLHVIHTEEDITNEILANEKLIFMELINTKRFNEYTVDAYYSRNGELVCVVPRERLAVRAGEMNQGRTDKGVIYNLLKSRLSSLEGARGCITAQFFYDKSTEELIGIEINPRFGGGYPLTYESGAAYSDFILKEYILNERVEPFDRWKHNLKMLRYDAAFFF